MERGDFQAAVKGDRAIHEEEHSAGRTYRGLVPSGHFRLSVEPARSESLIEHKQE
jgi:hypothetical protein